MFVKTWVYHGSRPSQHFRYRHDISYKVLPQLNVTWRELGRGRIGGAEIEKDGRPVAGRTPTGEETINRE